MTGLDRETRRRRKQAERREPAVSEPVAPGSEAARCSRGNPPSVCCAGDPWGHPNLGMQIMYWGEPLYPSVIEVAARTGLDPHDLAGHVEGEHGWEPHNAGYDKAVESAAECVLAGLPCELMEYHRQLRERANGRADA